MSKLLTPASIAKLDLKNRVVMSPMCMFAVEKKDGIATEFHFAHYGARAIGQVGLIIIEATAIEPDGRISDRDLGLWNDEQGERLKTLVDFLHSLGSKVGIQLSHAGRKAVSTPSPIAPSPIPFDDESRIPRSMSEEDVARIVDGFASAAKRAKRAGFDVIEVHGAHGYLLDEFLSPATNKRNDGYGGSLRNRYRIVHEIIERIRAFYDGSLWIRLSLTDYAPEGEQNSIQDWQQVGLWLEEDGIDCIDVSTGGLLSRKPNIPVHPGYQVPYAAAMKEAVSIPVAAVGLLHEPGLCEHILQMGHADLVLEGRALIRDINWLAEAAVELHDHNFKVYSGSYMRGEPDVFEGKIGYEGEA